MTCTYRSFLGPQLFSIYIDDVEEEAVCEVSKFYIHTEIGGRACCDDDICDICIML